MRLGEEISRRSRGDREEIARLGEEIEGLKAQLCASDDDEAADLRQEIAHLRQEIAHLRQETEALKAQLAAQAAAERQAPVALTAPTFEAVEAAVAEAAEAARVDTERRMEVRMHAQLSELEGLLGQLESAAPALVRSRAAAVVAKEAAERLAERAKQSRPGAATVAAGVALLADAAREGKDGHTAAQEAAAVVAVAEARRPLQEALLEVQAQLQAREAEVETLRTSLEIAQQQRQRPLPSTPKGADATRRLGQAPAAGAGAGALGTVTVPAAELDEMESTLSRLEMTLLRKGAWRAPPADAMMLSTPARARPVIVEQAPETAPEWELEPPSPIRFVVDLWQKVTGGQPEATPAPKPTLPVDAAGRGAGRGGAGRGVGAGRGGVSGGRGSVGGGRGSGAGSPTGSAVAGATAAASGFEMPDVDAQRRKDELLLVDFSARSKELVAHGKACQRAVRAAVDEMAREVDRAQSEASIACGRLSLRVGEAELERARARRELREAVVSGKVAAGAQLYRVPSPSPAPARAPSVAQKAAAERAAAERAAAEKAAAERAAAEKAAAEKAAAERAAAQKAAAQKAAA